VWGSIQLEYATAPTTVGAWTNSAGQGLRQDCPEMAGGASAGIVRVRLDAHDARRGVMMAVSVGGLGRSRPMRVGGSAAVMMRA